jgi:hypothetical protein
MPFYHFNVNDGDTSFQCEGSEMKNLAQAKCEAVKLAGRLICDGSGTFWDRAHGSLP